MTLLTSRIQGQYHQWKKYVERQKDYVEKWTIFGYISCEYTNINQLMNFAGDHRIIICLHTVFFLSSIPI